MTYTLYEGFVLQTKRALTALKAILQKASEHPNAATFPTCRLHADMKSFSCQVWAATTQTLMVLARLTDTEPPVINPHQDMFQQISHALKALEAADEEYILEHCEEVKATEFGGGKPEMPRAILRTMMAPAAISSTAWRHHALASARLMRTLPDGGRLRGRSAGDVSGRHRRDDYRHTGPAHERGNEGHRALPR